MDEQRPDARQGARETNLPPREDAPAATHPRSDDARRRARAALAAASHITDDALLDRLVDMGISTETVVALSLVPLISVAWADGWIHPREKRAVMAAAYAAGLAPGGPGARLVERCLTTSLPPPLRAAWREYIAQLCATRTVAERRTLRDEVLRQSRVVAEAAGGFKGLFAVSAHEAAVLDEIAAAFGG